MKLKRLQQSRRSLTILGLMVMVMAIFLLITPLTLAQSAPANLPRSARVQRLTGQGKVRVQRDRPPQTLFARQGTELNRGDLISPDKGVQVSILCPNGLQRSVKAVTGLGKVCPVWKTDASRGNQDSDTAGGLDSSIPYLITPRHTLLLNAKPLLQWNPVPSASQYTVEVIGASGTQWATQTKDTQITYAGKPLEPGVAYSLVVTTDSGRSSQADKTPDGTPVKALDFRVLRPAEAAAVQAITSKLLQANPNDEATALMLASYYGDYSLPSAAIAAYGLSQDNYQTYSLSADAIETLQAQLKQGKQSPLLSRTLGDLYWQTGLLRLAGEAYTKAIAQVQTPEDLEEWTLAYYGLSKVYVTLGDPQQTLQCLTQARIGFIFLGNQAKAKELEGQIEQLKKAADHSLNRQKVIAIGRH
mgnify:CR=1 FL=1